MSAMKIQIINPIKQIKTKGLQIAKMLSLVDKENYV